LERMARSSQLPAACRLRDPVFTMFTVGVPAPLLLRLDRYPHALIEPGRRCPLSHFETDLAGTRTLRSKACE
jgi:hypothetical protein